MRGSFLQRVSVTTEFNSYVIQDKQRNALKPEAITFPFIYFIALLLWFLLLFVILLQCWKLKLSSITQLHPWPNTCQVSKKIYYIYLNSLLQSTQFLGHIYHLSAKQMLKYYFSNPKYRLQRAINKLQFKLFENNIKYL